MSWNIWDKMPGIGSLKHLKAMGSDIGSGDWSGAGKEFARSADPIINDAIGYQEGQDEKKHGYDAVQGMAERLKQERMARADAGFAKADAMYDPTKKAMMALYGDPSTWSLDTGMAAPPSKARGRF